VTTATQHQQYAKAVRKAHRRIKDKLTNPLLKDALAVTAHHVRDFLAKLIETAVYHENAAEYLARQEHEAESVTPQQPILHHP
jgi:hypothetical protein